MKLYTLALFFAGAAGSLLAVEVGDSYESVVQEKGAPTTKMDAGSATVMKYQDMTIKLKEGKVVEIKTEVGKNTNAQKPAPATSPTLATVAAGQWTTDYPAALRQAKAEKKKVFLLFTGSDWCVWCKKLEGEILGTSDFKSYAGANLILVKLDFPQNVVQSAQVKAANQKLLQQYGVEGFPTVIVLNSEGKTVAQLGYMEGGPQPFIAQLKKL